MKILALSVLALGLSSAAFAAAPAAETMTTARLLINNPAIVTELNKHGTDNMLDMTATEVKPGVTRYVMTFNRNCECVPATAHVTIQEDMTPTYVDGAPKYEASIEINEGN